MALTEGQQLFIDLVSLAASVLYFVVAYVFSRREVSHEAKGAQRGFVLFWAMLGSLSLFSLMSLLDIEILSFGLNAYRAFIYPVLAWLLLGIGGLVYYLAYVYTGKPAALRAVQVSYLLLFIAYVVLIEGQGPMEPMLNSTSGDYEIENTRDAPVWLSTMLGLLLTLPIVAGALAYFGLYFRVDEREAKYRILLVSGGLIIWFGFSALNSIGNALSGTEASEQSFPIRLISALLGVIAATAVLLAYAPPKAIKAALHRPQQ